MIGGRYSGLGIASLILIFSALCLTAVSLLNLFCANKELSLTQKFETSIENYYSADSAAVITASDLIEAVDKGNSPSKINGIEIHSDGNGIYHFSVPINNTRIIAVSIKADYNGYCILSWQEKDTRTWSPSEDIAVWTGNEIPIETN